MAKSSHEDLFEGTTMTFGEHLEELRVCLTRALVALVVGSLIGLIFANYVVAVIQRPLLKALEQHYSELAVMELEELYAGQELDPKMVQFVRTSALIFEDIYLERRELYRLTAAPNQMPESPPGERASEASAPNGSDAGQSDAAAAGASDAAALGEEAAADQAELFRKLDAMLEEKLAPPQPDMVKTRFWRPAKAKLTTLSPHESFMIWVKAGIVAGLLLACPVIFHQLWTFVAAGLYPHERQYVYIYLPFSVILFLSGAALAFFFVFGPVLNFLFGFSRMLNIDPDLRISEVISFVLFLPLGFGIAFQLPLVMLFLHRIGLFTVEMYLEKWRIAILVICVTSMLLTPSDPYSMLLMAIPLTMLYFLGLGLCQWMPRGRNPFDEAYEP